MRRRWRTWSLAEQFLVLQLGIVLLVLVAVGAVLLAQTEADFRRTQGHRLLSVAETVAATSLVRQQLDEPTRRHVLAPLAEEYRGLSDATFVVVADAARAVITSPDPTELGRPLDLGDSPVLTGRSWVGVTHWSGRDVLVAHVPLIGDNGEVIGLVAVGLEYPTWWQRLAGATPNLLAYLGVATVIGVVGSYLLSRHVKRQTLGLEPREISGLVEHREATLHGIREGVIALDLAGHITMLNDQAAELLGLPVEASGPLAASGLPERLVEVLTGDGPVEDQIVLVDDRVLVLNRMPISVRGRPIGSVTTLRDRTELISLRRELDVTRHVTDTLRAQKHEFANQLHTIAGLIELGEYDEVRRFVTRVGQAHDRLTAQVTSRVADPAVAALLIAKASLATEQGCELRIAPQTRLGALDDELSADLTTVVGNLIDNALEVLRGRPGPRWVEVELRVQDEEVLVRVRDSGPGVDPELADAVFRRGFTTKAAGGGERGLGLALVRLLCTRRGGWIGVHNDGGAVFTARLPLAEAAPARNLAASVTGGDT